MPEPAQVPEWIVQLIGRQQLEIEWLQRENERLREEMNEDMTPTTRPPREGDR